MRRPATAATTNAHFRRRTIVALTLSLSLVGAAIGTLPAGAEPRPTIAQVQARVAELNEQAEYAAEAYNAGKIELESARAQQASADRTLKDARKTLDSQRGAIGEMAADAYRAGDGGQSSLAILMTSDDPKAIFEKLSTLGAIQRQQATTLRRVEVARQGFEQAKAEASQRAARAQSIADGLQTKSSEVTSLLDQAQKQLNRLTAEERARIEAARVAKAKADAAAAAKVLAQRAQEAAAAAKAPAPSKSKSSGGGSTTTLPKTSSSGKGKAAGAVDAALSKLGKPYVWAAAGPNSFDCSGLIQWAYKQVGVSVAHYTGSIWNSFPRVNKSDLQPGDIVFFYPDVHHAGIYIGNGQMVHAPQTGDVVKISSIGGGRDYTGAVRIVG